jgi:hypothetical protein
MPINKTGSQTVPCWSNQQEAPVVGYSDLPEKAQVDIVALLSSSDAASLRMATPQQNQLIEGQPCLRPLLLGKCAGPLPKFPHAALQRLTLPYGGLQKALPRIEQIHKNGEVLNDQGLLQDDSLFNNAIDYWLTQEIFTPSHANLRVAEGRVRLARQDAADHLDLRRLQIQVLPPISGLSLLKVLDLDDCTELTSLPECLGDLSRLEKLYLGSCTALKVLPDRLCDLPALDTFFLVGCTALTAMPTRIGHLTALKELYLSNCTALKWLPEGLGGLVNLERCDLYGCIALQALPQSICELKSLAELDFRLCDELIPSRQSIPEAAVYNWLKFKLRRLFGSPTNLDGIRAALPSCVIRTE